MTIKEASKKLGMNEQAIRTRMRKGKLPIGICIRSDERWTYHIYSEWVNLFIAGSPVTIPEGMSDRED